MQAFAVLKHGKCLSNIYLGADNKLLWECEIGHQWFAKPKNVYYSNKWCPECNESVGERICRYFFEQIFCATFKKSRPRRLS